MAVYRGKIDLIDMREITQAGTLFTWIRYADDILGNGMSNNPEGKNYIGIAYNKVDSTPSNNPKDYTWTLFKGESGIGLINTKTYYAISNNGVMPPIDLVPLTIIEEGILALNTNSNEISLIINNQNLAAKEKENIINLNILNDKISSIGAEWTEEIPEVPHGFYLWNRTVFYYSDGTTSTQYTNSYHGKDGEQGQDGIDAGQFKLQLNQTEILKFMDNYEVTSISPENLRISLIKNNLNADSGWQQITDLDILQFSAEIYGVKTGKWYQIEREEITIDESSNFNINLSNLIKKGTSEDNEAAILLLYEECILKVQYIHSEINARGQEQTYNLTEFANIRYAMNKDMASLSLKANGIVASIQDSKLQFDANGLTVQNGAFIIKDKNGQNLLYSDNGNLALKGNIYAEDGYFKGKLQGASGTFSGELVAAKGTFSGELAAAKGTFSGELKAATGEIGGFKIGPTTLFSTDNETNPAISLDGANGKIVAQNIELGTGATIKEYIKLGSGKVTLNNSSKFLTVRKEDNLKSAEVLSINDEGVIAIGVESDNMITIDGANGIIKSQNYDSGLGWKISSLESIFNDVTVRGSIRASVLEYGEVQTVGGALIVRPSSRIKNIKEDNNVSTIFVEDSTGFNINDWCLINKDLEKVWVKILDVTENILTIEQKLEKEYIGHPIVNFGKTGSIGIGINGSTNSGLIEANSLSVFEFNEDNKNKLTPRIILGKLPDDGYGFASGTYGLYAENVLLKGSLVTSTVSSDNETIVYSGISTLYSGANSPTSHGYKEYFGESTGEILLWAGAAGTRKSDVEESKFFVDKNGNLVAKSGYFKGTIITDAQITASEIITAKIAGNGTGPALTISDASLGIVFQKLDKTDPQDIKATDIFVLAEDRITAKVPSIVFNDNFKITEDGSVVASKIYLDGFNFNKGRINYSKVFDESNLNSVSNAYIDFEDGLKLSPDNFKNSIIISASQIELNDITRFSTTIKYGVNDNMKYEPVYNNNVLIGYDLYIN